MKSGLAFLFITMAFVITSCGGETTARDYIAKGDNLQAQGRYAEAVQQYTKAIELEPGPAESYSKRAGAYVGQGLFPQAIADATSAINIDPTLVQPYQLRGMSYLLTGNKQEAKNDLEKVLTLTDDPSILALVSAMLQTINAGK